MSTWSVGPSLYECTRSVWLSLYAVCWSVTLQSTFYHLHGPLVCRCTWSIGPLPNVIRWSVTVRCPLVRRCTWSIGPLPNVIRWSVTVRCPLVCRCTWSIGPLVRRCTLSVAGRGPLVRRRTSVRLYAVHCWSVSFVCRTDLADVVCRCTCVRGPLLVRRLTRSVVGPSVSSAGRTWRTWSAAVRVYAVRCWSVA